MSESRQAASSQRCTACSPYAMVSLIGQAPHPLSTLERETYAYRALKRDSSGCGSSSSGRGGSDCACTFSWRPGQSASGLSLQYRNHFSDSKFCYKERGCNRSRRIQVRYVPRGERISAIPGGSQVLTDQRPGASADQQEIGWCENKEGRGITPLLTMVCVTW